MKPSLYRRILALLLCICIVGTILQLPTKQAEAKSKTGVVIANSLNIRTGAGTNYDKLQVNGAYAYLTKGQTVTIVEESTGWYYIKFNFNGESLKGYVSADYIRVNSDETEEKITPTPTPKPTVTPTPKATPTPTTSVEGISITLVTDEILNDVPGVVNASILNVRSKASTSGSVVAKLKLGSSITIVNELITSTGKWYKIEVNDTSKVGYVLSDYISIEFDSSVKGYIRSDSKVYPRTKASNSGTYIKSSAGKKIGLSDEKSVTILAEKTVENEKWFQISFKVSKVTYKGYVKAEQVRFKQTVYEEEQTVTKEPTVTAKPTTTNEPTKAPTVTKEPTPTPTATITPVATPTPTESVVPTTTITPVPTTTATPSTTPSSSPYTIYGGNLYNCYSATLYVTPGYGQSQLTDEYMNLIYVTNSEPIAVYERVEMNGTYWYYIGVNKNSKMYYGYLLHEFVQLNSSYDELVKTWPAPSPSGNGTGAGGGIGTIVTPTPTYALPSNEAFEAKLANEGFPESYKVYLRQLHQQYPLWEFEAYQTNLNWSEVIAEESEIGLNLITNSKSVEWKSLATDAYNWKTDKFKAFDGSTWVTASEAAVAYYMDPRNFLTADGIFQFELLSYRNSYQNVAGVENILNNTALANKSFTYYDDYGNLTSSTYGQAFIAAAEYSKVSPYHLATRVKQEVVTGKTTLSDSVTGTVSGYEGLYNFYNIGAYHSTKAGGAIINALKYALNGTSNANLNALYRIPWDNPFDAIVGGSYIIGQNYINRGDSYYHSQDTIYLQKFNVTNKTTYSHQYMANVEAPYAESKKMYTAYDNLANLPIVFSIPVYNNMPEQPAPYPTKQYNPNNWLKKLSITDRSGNELVMTPTFEISSNTEYTLIVDSDIDIVNVSATTVSSKANILSGTGMFVLNEGVNQISIMVLAENGDTRIYNIYIIRE